MRSHRFPGVERAARALALLACALLLAAAPAAAMPAYDDGPPTTAQQPAVPTVVRETIVRHVGGPGTVGYVLLSAALVAALLGAGYLGALIANRAGVNPS
jgi:hypothetical protein